MSRTLIATLLLSAAMGGAAVAQTTPAPSTTETPAAAPCAGAPAAATEAGAGMGQSQGGFYTYQEGDQMLGSGLMGARIMGANGESIGTVDDLLLDRDGQVVAVVVGVGGFLGIGEKDVAIANDQLEFVLGQDAAAGAGTASSGTATAPGTAATAPGTDTAAGTAPAAGTTAATGTAAAPGMATTPGGAATGTTTGTMAPANGTATGMMGNGWGWSGAGIDHIQVAFTREQLESAPAFETAE